MQHSLATLSPAHRTNVAHALRHVLGNTCRLAMTTLNYHWNVDGAQFVSLHRLLDEQSQELWTALDPIAERVRAIGQRVVADYSDRIVVPTVQAIEDLPASAEMVQHLIEGHSAMETALMAANDVAQDVGDEASSSILGERLVAHGKHLWMLQSTAVV